MANEAQTGEGRAEIWEMATQTYGEAELQVLKEVHWKALTVLNKLHKRDRRAREKAIAEFAREASKGAAGLLHRLTKPRAVWCPRDAAQGEATNPRDAAELAAKSWSRIWRVHVEDLQTGRGRPQTARTTTQVWAVGHDEVLRAGPTLTRMKVGMVLGRCLPGKHAGRSLTWRLATHECGVGGGSMGRAAGRV